MKKIKFLTIAFTACFLQLTATAQNNTITKAQLNHISHYVVNLATSTAFYMNIIGLDTIPEPFHDGRHTWFSIAPKSHLHLILGANEPLVLPKRTHICFTVASVADFIKVLEKNKIEFENLEGVKMTVTTRVDGVKQIYFKDPDGYWVEINDAKD